MDNHLKRFISTITVSLISYVFFSYISLVVFPHEFNSFDSATYFPNFEKNSIDVLFLGSSHMRNAVNPMQLFESNGITSYNLNSKGLSPVETEVLLKLSLDYQTPQLVVMDVLSFVNDINYFMANKNYFPAFPLSVNKVFTILRSELPDKTINLFPLVQYHSRIQAGFMSADEFTCPIVKQNLSLNGIWVSGKRNSVKDILIAHDPNEIEPLNKEKGIILQDIIDFTKKKGIPLLLIKVPCTLEREGYAKLNYIAKVANENNIPFVNFNQLPQDQFGLDWNMDFYDNFDVKNTHLNLYGAEKVTGYLGKYLQEHYTLPDHRGEEKFRGYEKGLIHYDALKLLSITYDLGRYLDLLANDPYLITIMTTGYGKDIVLPTDISEKMKNLGFTTNFCEETPEGWIGITDYGKAQKETVGDNFAASDFYSWRDGYFYVDMAKKEEGNIGMMEIQMDHKPLKNFEGKFNIIVFDKSTSLIVDFVSFDPKNAFQVEHFSTENWG